MARLTFTEARTAFENDDDIQHFTCIALPKGCTCANNLWPEQKEAAKRILRLDPTTLTLKDVRNVVNCLVCESHQRTYTWKKAVEKVWKDEFPSFDFTSHRSPSPLSLCPSSASRRRRQSASPLLQTPEYTPPTSASSSSEPLQIAPHGTNLNERLHARAVSDSIVPTTPALNGDETSPTRNDVDDMQLESPLAGRGRTLVAGADSHRHSPPPSIIEPSPEGDTDMQDAATACVEPQAARQADLDRFNPGDASTWAPWTIRSEVLSILLETLPEPKTRGSIYAVRVNSTPYVKIGYTTKKVQQRFKDIEKKHGEKLDSKCFYKLSGIPILQLLRLEALVHADLAYFQRNLRVPNGRSHRFHREYFQIDLAQAERTIVFWWNTMKDVGLERGRELDSEMCERIKTNPALKIQNVSAALGAAAEAEHWHCLNSDHKSREDIWNVVFQREQGGFGKQHYSFGLIWPIGGLLCFVLVRETARIQPLFIYVCIAGLLLAMRRWR